MTDKEEEIPGDLNVIRGRLRRRLTKLKRSKAALKKKIEEEPVATLSLWEIRDTCATTETDRIYHTKLSNYLADHETDNTLQEEDDKAAETYQKEVQQMLKQCFLLNSMKVADNATQELLLTVNNLSDLHTKDPAKSYSPSLKVLKDDIDQLKKILAESPME